MFKMKNKIVRQIKKHERLAKRYSKKASKIGYGMEATHFYTRYSYHAKKANELKESIFQ